MSAPVISVRGISKRYHLGVISRQTLGEELRYWWHKARRRNPLDHMGTIERCTRPQVCGARPQEDEPHAFWALTDLSFDIQAGEAVGIIGSNGAGKSTLLKVLSRITEPTAGEAIIEGRVGSLLEVGTGFHPDLTGRENIYMNGTILGMKKVEIDRKFDEIVAFAEIEPFLDTPVKRYSSGMYVRLAFAVAAHLDPEILLVDEVLAVGDLAFQSKCLSKMDEVAESQRTILFVSHNIGSIRRLCRRSMLLDRGRLLAFGPTEEVVERYQELVSKAVSASDGNFVRRLAGEPVRATWVRAITLLNRQGCPCTRFRYGDGLTMRFFLGGRPARKGTSLVWLLSDIRGNRVAWSNSDLTCGFTLEEGATQGECEIPHLPLARGKYVLSFSCGLIGTGEPKDIWNDAALFEISTCDPFGTKHEHTGEPHGGVVIDHIWRASSEAPVLLQEGASHA